MLSILVVNYDSWQECITALDSFARHRPPMPVEVIVVDNASPQQDEEAIAKIRELLQQFDGGELVLHDENSGYSKGMNLALSKSRGDYVLVSNPDIYAPPGAIEALLANLDADDSLGAVAPDLYWDFELDVHLPPNMLPTIRDSIGRGLADISRWWLRRYSRKRTHFAVAVWDSPGAFELPMISGCFFVMRRSLIDELGFFDEQFPLYFEDTDLSNRIRAAGKRIVQVPDAKVVHLYGRSAGKDFDAALERYWRSRALYYRKYYGWFGAKLDALVQRLLRTGWAKRRSSRPQHLDLVDLGSGRRRPEIRFDKEYERYLVEVSIDPKFFLAGGVFGSGDSWRPSDSMFGSFGMTTYYFRVVDVGDAAQPVVGIYSFTLDGEHIWD